MTRRALPCLLACLLALPGGAAPAAQDPLARALEALSVEDVAGALEQLGGEPDADAATALAILGNDCEARGEYESAARLRLDALRMRRELFGTSDLRTLAVVQALMEACLRQGRYVEGAAHGERNLAELEPEADAEPMLLAHLFNLYAVNLQALGEYSPAEEYTRRALELVAEARGPSDSQYMRLLSNLANLLGEQGRLREAREVALEALDLRGEFLGEESVDYARSLMVLARLWEQQGDFAAAEEHLHRAERIFRAGQPVNGLYLCEALRMLGGLALTRGDVFAAEAAFREARTHSVAAQGAAHPDTVACDLGIGFALYLGGRAAEALPIFEAAAAANEAAFGAEYDGTVQARISIALAREYTGDVAGAAELMGELLELVTGDERTRPELESSLRSNLARCLMTLGEFEPAEEQLQITIAQLTQQYGADSVFLAEPKTRYALLLEARGELAAAEARGREAMAIQAAQRDRVLGADVERSLFTAHLGYGDMGRLVARLCLARGDLADALDALEQTRARTLLDGLLRASRDALRSDSSEESARLEGLLQREELARATLRELEAQDAAQAWLETPADDALQERIAAARNSLSAATAALGMHARSTTASAQPASLARVRASLEDDEVLLSFLWSDRQVSWISVRAAPLEDSPRAGRCAVDAASVAALTSQVSALARELATDPRRRSAALPPLPGPLAALAALPELAGARRVYVVPDGPLSALPFELLLGDGVREVVMLPSASTLVALAERAAAAPATAARRAVVLGDPTFGAQGVALARSGRTLARLPATRAEAEYVGALLSDAGLDVRVLTGDEATRAELESACQGIGLLHLATHGFSGSGDAPFDAALALASAPEGSDESVAALTLDRLIRRWSGKLDGCQLVVLSACDTHREVSVGTGAFSLATGFFQAGTQAVLASLWKVDEQATALLMGRFVENLSGRRATSDPRDPSALRPIEALPCAAALREAQTWLRGASRQEVREASRRMGLGARSAATRSGEVAGPAVVSDTELRPYADPYFWAGFVLIGRAAATR